MRAEHVATIIARSIGLGFVVMGATDALYAFPFIATASSGWASYSPLNNAGGNTSFSISESNISVVLPCLAQLVIGSAMILFGKPIGRWLARGLKDDSSD